MIHSCLKMVLSESLRRDVRCAQGIHLRDFFDARDRCGLFCDERTTWGPVYLRRYITEIFLLSCQKTVFDLSSPGIVSNEKCHLPNAVVRFAG